MVVVVVVVVVVKQKQLEGLWGSTTIHTSDLYVRHSHQYEQVA